MTIGIFKFIVKVVEYIIGADWRKILKNIYSMWRAIFWCTVWLLAIFAGWIVFALETFLKFWRWVGDVLIDLLHDFWAVVADHAGEIWFVIAIIGSIYGLFRVTLKQPDWFLYLLHCWKKTPVKEASVADDKK